MAETLPGPRTRMPDTQKTSILSKRLAVVKAAGRGPLLLVLLIFCLALTSPFFGILYPPLVDLPEHLLISKLLWEKLMGISNLDLEISTFLGYKLFPYTAVVVISLCRTLGISLLNLPIIITVGLIITHVITVVGILYPGLKGREWKMQFICSSIILPAAVSMYSACWFIGFVNYTLAVTFLLPAIVFTERYLRNGNKADALWLFVFLCLMYLSHPFVPVFWLLWCLSRGVISICTLSLRQEWKRFFGVAAAFIPIAGYHFLATRNSPLAPSTGAMTKELPWLSLGEWYQNRMVPIIDGTYLKADSAAESTWFAAFLFVFFLLAVFFAFRQRGNAQVRKGLLSCLLFAALASLINEKFIPVPAGHWLAYDYRFSTTIYSVCTLFAAMVLIRTFRLTMKDRTSKIVFAGIAALAVLASVHHLYQVRAANERYDAAARDYMDKVLNNGEPPGKFVAWSRWHPDGTLVRLYVCMVRPDCNLEGTTFYHGYSGDLYPVKYGPHGPHRSDQATVAKAPDTVNPALSKPRGLAVDKHGNYYVADSGNGVVKKFDPTGNFLSLIGTAGDGPGKLKEPNGVAVDERGNIYITDALDHKLLRFFPSGAFDSEWSGPSPGFVGPRDVAIGPNKNVYIVDQGRTRIVRFDPASSIFTTWGSRGSEPGQFIESTGIVISGNEIFVMDLGNDRIQVFDLDGNFLRDWSVPEWGKYPWHFPHAAVDEKERRLFVTNGWKNEILTFDLNGNRVTHRFEKMPVLANPSALVPHEINGDRRLLILNTESAKVEEVKLDSATNGQVSRRRSK